MNQNQISADILPIFKNLLKTLLLLASGNIASGLLFAKPQQRGRVKTHPDKTTPQAILKIPLFLLNAKNRLF